MVARVQGLDNVARMRRRRYSILLVSLLVATCAGGGAPTPAAPPLAQLVVRGTVVTMDDAFRVLRGGAVVVERGRIAAVLRPGEPLPPRAEGFPVVRVDGFVYPGLVNAHNHLAYNTLPPWPVPLVGGRPLAGVDGWTQGPLREEYLERLTKPKRRLLELGLAAEMGKWAELKELAGGTTTTQGSFGFRLGEEDEDTRGFAAILARNVDLEQPLLRQSSTGIYVREARRVDVARLADVLADVRDRGVFLVHLSEGRTRAYAAELYDLNNVGQAAGGRCGPLLRRTTVIHGTPYGPSEFRLLADCRASLVAAPLSNLLYYGTVPDLAAAAAAGVNVALSTDWSAVGSRTLLEELKVADTLGRRVFSGPLSARTLVEMVTRNPARALGWSQEVGRIERGLRGDLLVLRSDEADPYRALVESTERDVALAVVGGDPVWGDVDVLRRLKPGDHEVVDSGCGFSKAVDATTAAAPKGEQTVAELRSTLARALGREPSPLFTCADRDHLDALARSPALAYSFPQLAGLPALLAAAYR